jgi:ABC-type transport system substrate-binding protein
VSTNRKQLILLAILVTVILLLTACTASVQTLTTTSAQATTQATTQATGKTPQNTLVLCNDKPNFMMVGGDPATNKGAPANMITHSLYDYLVRRDKDNQIQPSLAESWAWAPDNLSITFKLKKGVKFHNGDSFTSADMKFSMETYMREDKVINIAAELRRMVKSIETADDYTIKISLTALYPALIDRLADMCAALPKAYYSKDEKYFTDHPVGTGPFRWVDYKQDDYVNFEAVPNHWRATPAFKYFTIRYMPEASTRLAMLKTGEADIIVLAAANIKEVKATPSFNIVWSKYMALSYNSYGDLLFPDQKLPFQDKRVRLAANLAVDTKSICDNILLGKGEPYFDHVPPWLPGYDPKLAGAIPEYNPTKAKALLAEAGYPNGFDTQWVYTITNQPEMEAVGAYLKAVGIRCAMKPVDDSGWIDTLFQKKTPGLVYNHIWWGGNRHIDTILSGRFTTDSQWGYIVTPETEAAIRPLRTILPDDQMAKLTREAVNKIKDIEPGQFLWAQHAAFATGPNIKYWENVMGNEMPMLMEYATAK